MALKSGLLNVRNVLQNTEQGASTSVWAATSKGLEGRVGKYLERTRESTPVRKGYGALDPGHAAHAYDVEDAKRLWEETMKMIGLEGEMTM